METQQLLATRLELPFSPSNGYMPRAAFLWVTRLFFCGSRCLTYLRVDFFSCSIFWEGNELLVTHLEGRGGDVLKMAFIQSSVRQTHTKASPNLLPSPSQPQCSPPPQEKSDNLRAYQVHKHLLSFLAPHSSFLISERTHEGEIGIKWPRKRDREVS